MKMSSNHQAGFTLVEVLVASSIALASMGLLLSLFASSLDRMARVEMQSQQLIVEKEILGRLSQVNPAMTRSGNGKIGRWHYQWRSEPLTEFREKSDYSSGEVPPGSVALFDIAIELGLPDGKTVDLSIRRLGWQS